MKWWFITRCIDIYTSKWCKRLDRLNVVLTQVLFSVWVPTKRVSFHSVTKFYYLLFLHKHWRKKCLHFSLKQSLLRSWKKLKFLRMKLIRKSNIDKIGFCHIISEISPLNHTHTLTHLCYGPLFYEHLRMKNE